MNETNNLSGQQDEIKIEEQDEGTHNLAVPILPVEDKGSAGLNLQANASCVGNKGKESPNVSDSLELEIKPTTETPGRYLNKSLFLSNIAAIWVSISKTDVPPTATILFIFFVILFRFKAFLDDNNSLLKHELDLANGKEKNAKKNYKSTMALYVISWILYNVSGYLIVQHTETAIILLSISFLFTNLWIIIKWINCRELSDFRGVYFTTNWFYLAALAIYYFNSRSQADALCIATNVFLLFVLLFDFALSKTLDKAYAITYQKPDS